MDVDLLGEKWEDMKRQSVDALEEIYVEFLEEFPHSEYNCKFWNRLLWGHVSKGRGLVLESVDQVDVGTDGVKSFF